ncbi:hypothetical protein ADL27_48020, partial [Streptomyces sp. NRRL F-6602]
HRVRLGGFTPLRPPVTREQAGPETGYVRLLHDGAVAEPPYYGQTTHFTCGAVTALVVGTLPGILSVYLGRTFEWVTLRLTDTLVALPFLLFAVAVIALLGNGLTQPAGDLLNADRI